MLVHKIKCLCKEKGISLAELEREVGYRPKAIYHITEDSSVGQIAKIAKLLDTTVEELLADVTED